MKQYGENVDEIGSLYGTWQIAEDTWVITNRWQSFMYLLIGEARAMLIDTGYGEGNLRAVVESITKKPIMVLNTHGHYDHTGGNGCWSDAWMSKEAFSIARQGFAPIHAQWAAEKPYPDYQMHVVEDGERIDLGGRSVEIIAIPAHNESSIAVLDKKCRLLFTGDELESGQVLLFVRNQNGGVREVAAAHKRNMQRLKSCRAEYDALCPAHNGTMLAPDIYLDDFIALDEALIAGTAQPMPSTVGFGFPPDTSGSFWETFGPLVRVQHGRASILYCMEEK